MSDMENYIHIEDLQHALNMLLPSSDLYVKSRDPLLRGKAEGITTCIQYLELTFKLDRLKMNDKRRIDGKNNKHDETSDGV